MDEGTEAAGTGKLNGLFARVGVGELAIDRAAAELRGFFEPQGSPGLEARLTNYLTSISSLVSRGELDADTAASDATMMTRAWREQGADLLWQLDLGAE